jgi:1,4-dihydroxy-2-naphthoyl-CoA synthase
VEAGQSAIEGEALRWAAKIIAKSPDAVLVTKEALNMARDAGKTPHGIDNASIGSLEGERSNALYNGDNIREGLTAFFEVRSIIEIRRAMAFIIQPEIHAELSPLLSVPDASSLPLH